MRAIKGNKIEIEGDVAKVWLNGVNGKGKYALIDAEDVEKIKARSWSSHKGGYAKSNVQIGDKIVTFLMHRFILEINNEKYNAKRNQCDHRNRNPLDNRKSNLRIVGAAINNKNIGLRKDNNSKTMGVSWNKDRKKWFVQISNNNERIYLGIYENKADAIKARKDAELKYWRD